MVDATGTTEPRRTITLLWSLRDLARLAREIENRVAERFAEAPADLNLAATRRLLEVGLHLVGRIGSLYGEDAGTDGDDLEGALREMFSADGEDGFLAGMEPDPPAGDPGDGGPPPAGPRQPPVDAEETRIGSLARIATLELGERLDDLAGLDPGEDPLEALAHASHARGAFLRAAIALEKLVCAAEGLRPRLASPQDLHRALAIRAAYARVARALCAEHPDDRIPPSRECLAREAAALGELLACPLTPHLRIADRIALARMHRRLLLLLQEPGPVGPEGRRTWQDLKGLFEMLLLVNNRQELREHDHEAARWLLERLPLSGPARLGPREQEVLSLLADREPALLCEGPDLDGERVGELRRVLLGIARGLAPAGALPEPAAALP